MSSNKFVLLLLTLACICHRGFCGLENTTNLEVKTTSKLLQKNCRCSSQWQCECCAHVNNDIWNVHQKLCADWMVFPKSWDIKANFRLNDKVLYTNTFSAWSLPPFCAPIWPALALSGCLQIHSIGQHEFNTLHGCGNVTVNFISFNLINWLVGCVDIGTAGIQVVEPDHEAENIKVYNKPPVIELETNETVQNET